MVSDILTATDRLKGVRRIICYQEEPEAIPFFQGLAPERELRPQKGRDLGERLATATAAAFCEGARQVVVIGSDSPDLPLSFIEQAFSELALGVADVVLGPTADGGYYLVGLAGVAPELFREIPWSTTEVLATTLARAAGAGMTVHLLPEWYDLDTTADLQRLALRDTTNRAPLTRAFIRARQNPSL